MDGDSQRIAWVAGATGLVGRALVDALLANSFHARVVALTRRPWDRSHARLANRIVQFDRLQQLAGAACNDAFCCLGSTLRSAGSREAFRAVDFDAVVAFAQAARAAGAQRFVVLSSVGADAGAKNFYLRTKGEMEQALEQAGFVSLDIVQPGMLLGGSRGRDARPLESVGRVLMPLVNPLLRGAFERYRGIDCDVLARALVAISQSGRRGTTRYTWVALRRLALTRGVRPPDRGVA
jgi:uncharacterized protein YbjT (DUF2867 family)